MTVLSASQMRCRPLRLSDVHIPCEGLTEIIGLAFESPADEVVAYGGLVNILGLWWTFSHVAPEARIPVVIHRAAVAGLRAIELGQEISRVYGYCDRQEWRSERWIRALGFRPLRDSERTKAIEIVESWCGAPGWVREMRHGS